MPFRRGRQFSDGNKGGCVTGEEGGGGCMRRRRGGSRERSRATILVSEKNRRNSSDMASLSGDWQRLFVKTYRRYYISPYLDSFRVICSHVTLTTVIYNTREIDLTRRVKRTRASVGKVPTTGNFPRKKLNARAGRRRLRFGCSVSSFGPSRCWESQLQACVLFSTRDLCLSARDASMRLRAPREPERPEENSRRERWPRLSVKGLANAIWAVNHYINARYVSDMLF